MQLKLFPSIFTVINWKITITDTNFIKFETSSKKIIVSLFSSIQFTNCEMYYVTSSIQL